MKYLLVFLLLASPAFAQSGKLKATATQHGVNLNWTAPANPIGGEYINIYRGTAAGAESTTPINSAGISVSTTTYADSNVTANTKYYYIAKGCAKSLADGSEVCSPPTNEVSVTIPLAAGDVPGPSGLTGSAN